jgi:hypothetical protein
MPKKRRHDIIEERAEILQQLEAWRLQQLEEELHRQWRTRPANRSAAGYEVDDFEEWDDDGQ